MPGTGAGAVGEAGREARQGGRPQPHRRMGRLDRLLRTDHGDPGRALGRPSWTSVRAPFGPRVPIAGFTATTGGIAWAVGGYTHNGYTRTLAARWDGTRWAITPTPNPSTAATLTGVSAISPTDAWAIGLTGQENSGFFMHWNGVRWTLQRAAGQFTAQTVDDGLAISEAPDGSAFAFGHTQGPQGTTIMRWQPPCWMPTPSPDAGASAPSHRACSLPTGGSPAPVVNPNAPAQRRQTVAGAEATLTNVLLLAQHDAYDAAHHKRFTYTSFNAGGGSIVQPPPLSKMGFAMLESLRQMQLGHLPKALAQLREATDLLNAHLASHPSDVPKAPPAWAVSWLMTRLPRANRQIARAAALAPAARRTQVRSWATKAVNWMAEDGIVNSEFFAQPGLPRFRPTWLSPYPAGARSTSSTTTSSATRTIPRPSGPTSPRSGASWRARPFAYDRGPMSEPPHAAEPPRRDRLRRRRPDVRPRAAGARRRRARRAPTSRSSARRSTRASRTGRARASARGRSARPRTSAFPADAAEHGARRRSLQPSCDVVDYGDIEVRSANLGPLARAAAAGRRRDPRRGRRAGRARRRPLAVDAGAARRSPSSTAPTASRSSTSTRTPTPAATSARRRTACPSTERGQRRLPATARNIVQVGLRGAWPFPEEFQWMREQGFRWHTMGEVVERGIAAVVQRRDRPRPRRGRRAPT